MIPDAIDLTPAELHIDAVIKADTNSRVFDRSSPYWVPTKDYNHLFLRGQENYMNEVLQAKGHLFLNEVYDALGFPRSRAGAVTGWLYDFERKTRLTIDVTDYQFAKYWIHKVQFNTDGVIFDQI